jgi:hypothetical protein
MARISPQMLPAGNGVIDAPAFASTAARIAAGSSPL